MFTPSGADESVTAGVAAVVAAGAAPIPVHANSVTASAARRAPNALSPQPRFDLDVIPHLDKMRIGCQSIAFNGYRDVSDTRRIRHSPSENAFASGRTGSSKGFYHPSWKAHFH